MILKETRLHSRTDRLPSHPDQSSVSRPWVADYYPESTSWRDLFLFCILKSQTGFRIPSTSAVGGPWSLWWEVVGLGIRLTCKMILINIFKKISVPSSRRSPCSWSRSRWSLQLVSFPGELTNPPPELPLAADFIDSFSARSTARPCKVQSSKCKDQSAKCKPQIAKCKV